MKFLFNFSKGLKLSLIAFVGLANLVSSLPSNAQVELRVMTYNIRKAVGPNGPNLAAQPYVADLINAQNPDVWVINELGGNNSGWNRTAARNSLVQFITQRIWIFGPDPVVDKNYFVYVGQFSDGFIGNAIVSKYPLQEAFTYADGLRGCMRASIDLGKYGGRVTIFGAHAKAFDDTTSAQRRQFEASLYRDNILVWRMDHPDDHVVMAGDMNEGVAGEPDNWRFGNVGDELPSGEIYDPIGTIQQIVENDALPRRNFTLGYFLGTQTISANTPQKTFDHVFHSTGWTTAFYFWYWEEVSEVLDTLRLNQSDLDFLYDLTGVTLTRSHNVLASDHLAPRAHFYVFPWEGNWNNYLFGSPLKNIVR